jgi:GntR family transcriptional repressor for pyruvate dehydrogenase complex
MAATDQAIDGIKQLLATGEFSPGDRLPKENELAERLGVSRGSLREAVRALEFIGVLQPRQGDGTYVTSLDPSLLLDVLSHVIDFSQEESILHLLEVRRLLEPAAAALAAARATPDQLSEVRAALDDMHRAGEPEPFVAADAEFHAAIARATGNPALAALLDQLSGPTIRTRIERAARERRAVEEALTEHERIVEALEAHDPELARSANAVHVAAVERWLRGVLGQAGAP